MRTPVIAVSLLLLSLACGPFQTYGQAMQIICDAPMECTECNKADPAERVSMLAQYISERVYNREAIRVFSALAMAGPEDKARLLRSAAAEGGVTDCRFAEVFGAP